MPPLSGKVAIVTGASRGIGRGIAMRFAHEGAAVMLCARDQAMLDGAVREIAEAGGKAAALALDLRLLDSPAKLVSHATQMFQRIDIVVNNAGATKRDAFLKLTDETGPMGSPSSFSAPCV
jgi:3-oxoacyl-[acyl-carrier protein] reductase